MGAFKQAAGGVVERIQTRKPHADALDIVASRDRTGPMVASCCISSPLPRRAAWGVL